MDGKTKKPIDIIECRYKTYLLDYFNNFSLSECKKVKYVVTDLWKDYKDLAKTYFPNAKVIADIFYFIRYLTESVDSVRKQVQDKLSRTERKYFKHSRKLLLSRYENLKDDKQKEELNYILINYSEDLRIAYREKKEMLNIIQMTDKEKSIEYLNAWIKRNLESDIPALKSCAKTYFSWITEIRILFRYYTPTIDIEPKNPQKY